MRKTFVIAVRDYLAAVKTKSFLIGLILMPVLTIGGIFVGKLSRDVVDTTEKKIAVIDRSEANVVAASTRPASDKTQVARALEAFGIVDNRPINQVLMGAAQERNDKLKDERTGRLSGAPYVFEKVAIPDDSPEGLDALRLEYSDKVRSGDYFAFIEIGPNIVETPPEDQAALAATAAGGGAEADDDDKDDPFNGMGELTQEQQDFFDRYGVRYSSKNTTNPELIGWITKTLVPVVQTRRLAVAKVDPQAVLPLMIPPAVQPRPLAVEETDGSVGYEKAPNMLVSIFLPMILLFLLFSLLATATFPLTTNIIEEKQLRIAEVLLGSVRPFELMLGKLLGGVAVSLTLAGIYLAGGLYAAMSLDLLTFVTPDLILWFIVFAILATLMVGSISVAAGAAVTNLKEAQNIQTPIVLLPMLPIFVAINVVQNPQGPLAHGFTWFPLTTPMTSVMRIAVRDGMPLWERFAAAGLSVVTTLVLVWIAGRIFRHGMLRSEKAAAFGDVVRWVTRG